MDISNQEWALILFIFRIILVLMFLFDLLRLLVKDRQKEIRFSFRTSITQELNRNISSMAAFLGTFVLFTLFDIRNLDATYTEIALDISILVLILVFFLVPKRIVIGEKGVYLEGTLHPWHRIRSAALKNDTVLLRRDRFYILPPIRILSEKSGEIHALALDRIEKKK